MTVRVIGLDLSVRSSGIALPDGNTRTIAPRTTSHDPARRLHEIVTRLDCHLKAYRPDLAVIEGYNLGAIPGKLSLVRLGELGGAVRVRLFELDIPFAEIPPSVVKQYATGSGAAKKPQMVAAAKACGINVSNDDEADAWWLHAMGRARYSEMWDPPYLGGDLFDLRAGILNRIRWPFPNDDGGSR